MIPSSSKIYLSFSFIILLSASNTYQQTTDCSYINGQGCFNGTCKFCAMCLPSACILATPLSTGVNEGSTCAVTHQTQGYDFYNYCLSSGMDDDGDYCNTSTICYSYKQGNASFASHAWDNLTCDSNTCNLINFDGSPPTTPIPIDNNSTDISTPTNVTTNHPGPGTGSGNSRPHQHYNQFDIKSGSPTSIALTVVCTLLAMCLLVWLTRILFYKTKYWPVINKYFCCGFMPYKAPPPNDTTETPPSMMTSSSTPNTAPPSFMDSSRRTSDQSLPSYFHQDPSPPKYEQAIVTQIRGMRFFSDHHPSNSNSGNTRGTSNNNMVEQPIWVPIYLSQQQQQLPTAAVARNSLLVAGQQDWATETMRHQPPPSSTTSSEEGGDIVDIHQQRNSRH